MRPRTYIKDSQYTLSKDEIRKIIDNTPSFRNRLIIKLLAGCGMRREEVQKLRVENIDWIRERIIIVGKYRLERVIPCPKAILNDLNHWLGKRRTGWVFPAKLIENEPLTIRQYNRIIKRAGEKAEIKNPNPRQTHLSPKIFRHSFARHIKSKVRNIEALQIILGHKNIEDTIELYGNLTIDDVEKETKEAIDFI